MKQLIIVPEGWPCLLKECPPGLFTFGDALCMKTEYQGDHPYLADGGEFFWGRVENPKDRDNLIVQPCASKWVDVDF